MKKIAFLIPVLCLAVSSFTAKADTLKLVGASDSPYQLQLNSGATLNLFCIDDFLENSIGESWNVNIVHGADLGNQGFSASTVTKYNEEAYIYSQVGTSLSTNYWGRTYTHTVTTDDVQLALWKIFDSEENLYGQTWAQMLVSNAMSAASNNGISASVIQAATFYIPDGTGIKNACDECDLPQTFVGSTPVSPVPEPSTLLMMGSGLMGLAGAVRRKLGSAQAKG